MTDSSFLNRHLRDSGENYFEHLLFTVRIAGLLFIAGFVIVVHGILPCVMINTGSKLIATINAVLCDRRARQKPAG